MRCKDLIRYLETLAPLSYACDWDNPGLLAGRSGKEVHTVYLALDATDEVVADAVSAGADFLLTHHPLIFHAIKKVTDEDFITKRLITLIQHDISYYAMHTNFDAAPNGMGNLAEAYLGMTDTVPLEVTAEGTDGMLGIGRVGNLSKPMTVEQLGAYIKDRFGIPFLTIYKAPGMNGLIQRVAVSPGAGGSMLKCGIASGASVLITGDIGHHGGIDAVANHMTVIDAGHYGLEHIFQDFMEQYLLEMPGEKLKIMKAPVLFPATVL